MNCREVEPLMAPYVDGDAAPHDRAAVDAHIEVCPPCRDDVDAQRAVRDLMRAKQSELRGCATSALRTRCAEHARTGGSSVSTAPVASGLDRTPDVTPVASGFSRTSDTRGAVRRTLLRKAPLAAAATIVLAVAAVFGLGLNNKVQALALQMTLDHMKCSRFNSAPATTTAGAAGESWASRFGWPLTVPPSSEAAGLELRAVRRCGVTDGRVAHLIYQWRGEPLSVYVLPSKAVGSSVAVERFGHQNVMWSQNGRTYVVLAGASRRADLPAIVQYMRANVH